MTLKTTWRAGATWALGLLLLAGCAAVEPRPAEEVMDFVINGPLEQTWPRVEPFLQQKGWSIELRDGFKMASGWREVSEGGRIIPGSTGQVQLERLVAVGTRLPGGRCSVRIAQQQRRVKQVQLGTGKTLINTSIYQHLESSHEASPHAAQESQMDVGPPPPLWVTRLPELERELLTWLAPPVNPAEAAPAAP